MRFTYTAHAAEMLIDRRLERRWVERTVLAPEAVGPGSQHTERTRAFRALPERDGRVLRVVYVRDAEDIRIVTLFLDRGRRRR